MDRIEQYATLIKQALRDYVALVQKSPNLPYQVVMAFDDEHGQYLMRKVGWQTNAFSKLSSISLSPMVKFTLKKIGPKRGSPPGCWRMASLPRIWSSVSSRR
ncbi:MAG: element excision factor XisI family protein [Caldilineaceae bacterium]